MAFRILSVFQTLQEFDDAYETYHDSTSFSYFFILKIVTYLKLKNLKNCGKKSL
jgi:hypothetical protein